MAYIILSRLRYEFPLLRNQLKWPHSMPKIRHQYGRGKINVPTQTPNLRMQLNLALTYP